MIVLLELLLRRSLRHQIQRMEFDHLINGDPLPAEYAEWRREAYGPWFPPEMDVPR